MTTAKSHAKSTHTAKTNIAKAAPKPAAKTSGAKPATTTGKGNGASKAGC